MWYKLERTKENLYDSYKEQFHVINEFFMKFSHDFISLTYKRVSYNINYLLYFIPFFSDDGASSFMTTHMNKLSESF